MEKIIKSFVLFTFLVLPSLVSSSNLETKLVTWSDLRKLNYKTGEMPESIRKLMGKRIKIPGFAVPLEGDDGFENVKEFLLVPTFGACIHVPPPPPNQVVHVILDKPVYFEKLMYAVWVSGIVEIGEYFIEGSSDFGQQTYDTETTYLLRGQKVEEYD
jgi:hypothetical protein